MTDISDAKPYTRAMTDIVDVHVDFDVITKYRARKCRCIDVNALATTSALCAPSTYDSSFDPEPVPCWTSPMFSTTRRLGSSVVSIPKNSSHADLSSEVTMTFSMCGSNSTNVLNPSRYSDNGNGGHSSSPFADHRPVGVQVRRN